MTLTKRHASGGAKHVAGDPVLAAHARLMRTLGLVASDPRVELGLRGRKIRERE
jgi:hypothetical protein